MRSRITTLAVALIVATVTMLLPSLAGAVAFDDLAIFSNTRYESHSIGTSKAADNLLVQNFTFMENTGHRSTAMMTLGFRYDLEDGNKDNFMYSFSHVHSFSRSSFLMFGYSNMRQYENADDWVVEDTDDSYMLMHGWKLVKLPTFKLTLNSMFFTDTAFSDNRMWAESFNMRGPLIKRFDWGAMYQMGKSLVSDRHTLNVWMLKVSRPAWRNGAVSVAFRKTQYKNVNARDTNDNGWIISYSHRLR